MPSGLFTRRQHLQAVITNSWAGRPSSVDYLVVAGGGGGGRNWGGGGGAGGLLQGTIAAPTTATTVTVGAGGLGDTSDTNPKGGTSGGNSIFGAIVALGGGLGGSYNGIAGAAGGSGGGQGAGSSPGTLGQGTFGQGNAGGSSPPENVNSQNTTGGGGGAGTIGISSTTTIAGRGGSGIASDMSGSRVLYAGGGGGTANAGATGAGAGGVGGGGTGSWYGTSNAISGTPNTGGGGGGAHYTGISGTGGSGIVIISYPGTTQWYSGGTLSYSNNRVVHTFYSSGTLTPIQPVEYADTTYQISRSLRFNSADSAYLNRTPASAGNRKTWTWSGWVKRSGLTASNTLFGSGTSGTDYCFLYFQNDDKLVFYNYSSAGVFPIRSTPLYRDVSAWYHVVVAVDTTQATASNRVKLWVNNQQITDFSEATYPNQNNDLVVNSTSAHAVGAFLTGSPTSYFNGYMAEVYLIDGQALTPQAFGFNNPNTGVWSPLRYTGSYGTNGFYLNFSDNSNNTASTLGKDNSGNTNNWTPNNFSVTAGAGNDSLVDSPTAYGTDTGVGGEVRGNYATLNPLQLAPSMLMSNGNLYLLNDNNAEHYGSAPSTIGVRTGKWYAEFTAIAAAGTPFWVFGIGRATWSPAVTDAGGWYGRWYYTSEGYAYRSDGKFLTSNTLSGSPATYGANDVIGVAIDLDAQTISFYKNGASQGTPFTSIPLGVDYVFAGGAFTNNAKTSIGAFFANFGQRPFAYSAPSGYKALCTQNLPTPTIGATAATQANKYFNTVTYTGSGTSNRIIPTGLQSDFVWIKRRDAVMSHILHDVVRGAGKTLYAEQNIAEANNGSYYVQQFNSDNFLIGLHDTAINANGATYVAWNWSASGAGTSNTSGTITSTVSANQTSGFSIVTFTASANSGSIGHGLGVAPNMIILKSRNNTSNWVVYHSSIGAGKYLNLNGTDAAITNTSTWQNTTPTSTVFYSNGPFLTGWTEVAYCFAAIPGFSAFGSYTGNGSTDGPFVYTGFRPAWIMIKRSDGIENWNLYDNKRNSYNVADLELYPNLSNSEGTTADRDFLSNGFKIRSTNVGRNASGGTYIYAAFAETPFKYSRAR